MRLPEHTKIQSGEREGENCEERVDPAHVQTENLSALEEVSTCIDKHFWISWFTSYLSYLLKFF